MKQLIFILLFPITIFGQTVSDTCFTEQQIDLLEENIDLYVKQQKKLQPKWYNNKIIWFSSGILTTVLTGKLIVGAIN